MTCYIASIDQPDAQYTLHIKRFDPEKDRSPYWAVYQVPFVETMTVMEALEYLWDQGEYLAFRANCREFTCGSCAMLVNGKPRLACDTLLENNMRLEPLSRFPVVKDLIVDTSIVKRHIKDLEYWPVCEDRTKEFAVPQHALDEYGRVFSRCIECYCCLEACPASASETSRFDGPMYMLQIARAALHPLDAMDRILQASEHGMWSCVSCFECADVCPVNLSPGEEIAKLRREAIKRTVLGFFGMKGKK